MAEGSCNAEDGEELIQKVSPWPYLDQTHDFNWNTGETLRVQALTVQTQEEAALNFQDIEH